MTKTVIKHSKICSIAIILFILAVLMTLPASYSKEVVETTYTGAAIAQFTAVSGSQESFCASAPNTDSITLLNQGTVPDTYYLAISSADPSVASWIEMGQTAVSLQPGQEQEVYLSITPPTDTAGTSTYKYTVIITSLYDSVKQLEKTFTVQKCPNIALSAYATQQESCPCSTGVYVFELANTGSSSETYDLSLTNVDPAYYVLSENSITLAAGETKPVYAYVRMACFVYGDFAFTMTAQTRTSGYTATIPLSLHIEQGCYNYNIALGEALIFDQNTPLTVSFTPASSTAYSFCTETPGVIPVEIQNPGDIMNEYKLNVQDAENWITPAEGYVRLQGKNEHISSIVVNSAAASPGWYSFALKADTLRGDLESVMPFSVEIKDCSQTGMAPWLKWTLLSLLALVALAIILVGALLYRQKKKGTSSRVLKKEHPLIQWIHQKRHLLWILLPLLLLILLVAWFAYPIVKEKYAETLAKGMATASGASTVPTLFYNLVTALILAGLLLLLVFLVWWFKLRDKNGKKKDTSKKAKAIGSSFFSKERGEKVKPYLKWIWIIFLLLLLLSGLVAGLYFLYMNYKEDASKFLNQNSNKTEEVGPTSTTTTENADIRAFKKQLQDLQNQIAEKEKQIAALDQQLVEIGNMAAQNANFTLEQQQAYENKIAALQKQIDDLEKQLEELQQQEKDLLDAISGVDSKIQGVDDHVTDLDNRLSALEEQIAALQKLIATLSLEKEISNSTNAQQIINATQQEITDLEQEKQNITLERRTLTTPEEIFVPAITDNSYKTVLLFDTSLSSQIVENGKTRFARGIEAAEKYVQEKGLYSIMIVGKNAIMIQRDISSAKTLKILHYLSPLDTQSNLGRALYKAEEDLHGQKGRIVLISDLLTTDGSDIYAIHRELEAKGIDVVFINVAQPTPVLVETTEEFSSTQESTVSSTEETTQQTPSFAVESQTAESFFIEIPENAAYALDLTTYFTDPDKDPLTYTATPGDHLTATAAGSSVSISPEKDWTGETTIVFRADDGKGGIVESPAILVRVIPTQTETTISSSPLENTSASSSDEPELITPSKEEDIPSAEASSSNTNYISWIILGSIIFLILLSLIIGAFAKKYHEPNHEDSYNQEKEHKEK